MARQRQRAEARLPGPIPYRATRWRRFCTLRHPPVDTPAGSSAAPAAAPRCEAQSGDIARRFLNHARTALLAAVLLVPSVALAAIGVNKTFNPANVSAGQTSTLTVILINNNPAAATAAALTDTLPGTVVVATPANASNTCGGGVTARFRRDQLFVLRRNDSGGGRPHRRSMHGAGRRRFPRGRRIRQHHSAEHGHIVARQQFANGIGHADRCNAATGDRRQGIQPDIPARQHDAARADVAHHRDADQSEWRGADQCLSHRYAAGGLSIAPAPNPTTTCGPGTISTTANSATAGRRHHSRQPQLQLPVRRGRHQPQRIRQRRCHQHHTDQRTGHGAGRHQYRRVLGQCHAANGRPRREVLRPDADHDRRNVDIDRHRTQLQHVAADQCHRLHRQHARGNDRRRAGDDRRDVLASSAGRWRSRPCQLPARRPSPSAADRFPARRWA